MEDTDVGQAPLLLRKAILTAPHHLLALRRLGRAFWGHFCPSSSLEMGSGSPDSNFTAPHSSSSKRHEGHELSSSLQKLLPANKTFRRISRVASQGHQPLPSAFLGATCQPPGTSVHSLTQHSLLPQFLCLSNKHCSPDTQPANTHLGSMRTGLAVPPPFGTHPPPPGPRL